MTDQMRKCFEFFYGLPFDECDVFMRSSWEAAWKASRETLVVDLPTVGPSPEPPEDAIDDSYLDAHHAKIRMRNACFKAITTAGITIKTTA